MTKTTFTEVMELLQEKFPGMEHYFVNGCYPFSVTDGEGNVEMSPHMTHGGYCYCGYVDSLSNPIHGRTWRAVTPRGLVRLLQAERLVSVDVEQFPHVKRRFKL